MTTEANRLKVGAFLIVGFLVFNAGLIWIGATRVFERRTRCVTYFTESVQGLEAGSAVKFRGVPIGNVTAVRIAPDGRLVEVAMEVGQQFRIDPTLRASLASVGITGVSFVQLDLPPAGAPAPEPPRLPFPPGENYIPAQRSFMGNIVSVLAEIAGRLQDTDLPGLVRDYRNLAAAAQRRIDAPEVDHTLARVARAAEDLGALTLRASRLLDSPRLSGAVERADAAAENLEEAARSARLLLGDPRLGRTIEELSGAAAGLRRLTEDAAAAVAGIGGAGSAAEKSAARWERTAADVDRGLRDALGKIGRAAGRLESLAGSLEASPSRLLLEQPAKEDFR